MKKVNQFSIDKGLKVLLNDSGVNVGELLRLAELPQDLFSRKNAGLYTLEYFRLWQAIEKVTNDPIYSIKLLKSMSAEFFSPPMFASLCSPNLSIALKRLQQFKPLIGPVKLEIEETEDQLSLVVCFSENLETPSLLIALELGFFVQLARIATREPITPLQVCCPVSLPHLDSYTEFFGVEPKKGNEVKIIFSHVDAHRPFITENEHMWEFFEPALRRRLADINENDDMTSRVRSALLELLPSGRVSIGDLANKLAMSKRTLQRRLGDEGTSFMEILINLREELARHYITNSDLPYAQISFLLGYDDPNSFFRAFHAWTGSTPDTLRSQSLH